MLDCHLDLGQRHTVFIADKNKTINLTAHILTFNYLNYFLRFLRTRMYRVSVHWRNRKDGNKITSLYILVKPSVWLFFLENTFSSFIRFSCDMDLMKREQREAE